MLCGLHSPLHHPLCGTRWEYPLLSNLVKPTTRVVCGVSFYLQCEFVHLYLKSFSSSHKSKCWINRPHLMHQQGRSLWHWIWVAWGRDRHGWTGNILGGSGHLCVHLNGVAPSVTTVVPTIQTNVSQIVESPPNVGKSHPSLQEQSDLLWLIS